MSIHTPFGLKDKEKFGGILELEDGEQEESEASEPTELPVPEIRKGDVLVARMTTSDECTTDTERPLKVLAVRGDNDKSFECIIDVVDVLNSEKGTVSLEIRDSVATIHVQRYKYTVQGWCGPEKLVHMPHLLLRRHLGNGLCMNTRFKMPYGQLGADIRAYRSFAEERRDQVTLVVISCLGEYRLVALGVGDVM